ncbi:hypothetical protein [Streptomyces sp. bgisy032]|uniref:restriction endonuclease subunit S n=1 Tax=Streptomyces sp. bgisy032 TaxID=3413773 RepID=UPI003D716049
MKIVPGLGEIPSTWSVERARWLLIRQRRAVRPQDGIVTAFRDGQVTLRENRRLEGFTNALQEIGYQGIRRGDLVVHGMDGFAGAIGVSDSDGKASPVVHAYRASTQMDARYLAHVLRTMAVNGYVATLAKGIRERSTAFDSATLANVLLPVPSFLEQRRIADFLDAETKRIDQLTELRTKTLELLTERITSHMDIAVRGVSVPGPKQISEYPPLGEVPLRWRQGRLRSIDCDVQTGPFGSQLHAEDYVEGAWPVINPANITPAGLVADDQVTVPDEVRARLERHVLRAGDVVFGRRGELGRAGIVEEAQAGWVCGTGSLRVRFTKGSFHPDYLRRYLAIPAVRHYFRLQAIGSTMPNLNSSILLNMPLLLPSFSEQVEIAKRCTEIESRATRHRLLLERQVQLLIERRQALITAAVTGQFDVSTASGRNVTEGVTV